MNGNGNRFYTFGLALLLFASAHLATTPSAGAATEYFVGLEGDDDNDGLSRAAAFATVQHGVDALSPGDSLTILSGEYFENISRSNLGGPDADTVIRAEIPGTVVIRGDVAAPEFRKLEGYSFVYVADFETEHDIRSVNELDTLRSLSDVPKIIELESSPAAFHHDAEAGKLYISTSDLLSAHRHRYSISLLAGSGIGLSNPRRVRLEGLSVTGFGGGSGISMSTPIQCVISDCRSYFNGITGIGIAYPGRRDPDMIGANVIERSIAWANGGNGINVSGAHGDTIRDSQAFLNGGCGIGIYNAWRRKDIAAYVLNNLAWGNGTDFGVKSGAHQDIVVERGVAPGTWSHEISGWMISNSLIGNMPRGLGKRFRDNIHLSDQDADFDPRTEFADPANHDYRLQATSRFRGAGADGADLGLPYEANVFYVSPEGNDEADGLSIQNAWATPERGLRELGPGDTLYLEPGRYRAAPETGFFRRILRRSAAALPVPSGTPEAPVRIMGRGEGAAVIEGEVVFESGRDAVFERLDFAGRVTVRGGENIKFSNCAFQGGSPSLTLESVEGPRVTRCLFAGTSAPALSARGSSGLFLAGNVYAGPGPAVALDALEAVYYADYNVYRQEAQRWQVGDRVVAENMPAGIDRYARTAAPEIVMKDGAARLGTPLSYVLGESLGMPVGAPLGFSENAPERVLRVVGPELHSTGATSANIEWWSSGWAEIEVAWGETPECRNVDRFELGAGFGSYSLTGLEPGKTYHFQLRSVAYPERSDPLRAPAAIDFDSAVMTFETPAADRAPVTWHVSPDGDDNASGRSESEALRTLPRAADLVRAGDTVLIGAGRYHDQILARVTGTPELPITFKARPGAKVVLDGNDRRGDTVILVQHKSYLRFDGLYFENVRSSRRSLPLSAGAVRVLHGRDIRLTRCFFDGHFFGPGQGVLWNPQAVYAWDTDGLWMENCVIIRHGMGGMRLLASSGVIRNSVFIRPKISQLLIENFSDQKVRLENSIFTETLPYKADVGMITSGRAESLEADNVAFYLRLPDAERKPFFVYDQEAWERMFFVQWAIERGDNDERSASVIKTLKSISGAEFSKRIHPGFFWFGDPRFAGTVGREAGNYSDNWVPLIRDFPDAFATEPELIERGIGLDPKAFDDFHFN